MNSAADTSPTATTGWRFDNTYSRLPEDLFATAEPARVREPHAAILNERLAKELGIHFGNDAAAVFAGQAIPSGARPIAQAYAGHQFGGFTMLGDGRAILLGEHRTPSGRLVDIQLKGAGRTRFSRGGDGRAALGPMLREYIISEYLAAVGIPTTRSLAVVTTGEPVYRTSPLRGAVLTRVAASHIRVGTFEYAARRGEPTLRALADYAIARHDPKLVDSHDRYFQFFRAVVERQASLLAQWQLIGFIHGVLNTDNVAISGEAIDFGPCAFMNVYHPGTVYSSIDHAGRYAYANQPNISQWNLARFAETLLPLFHTDTESAVARAMEVLNDFPARFDAHWLARMERKLGLVSHQPDDRELFDALLSWMEHANADFTNTFRDLSNNRPLIGTLYQTDEFLNWHARWQKRLADDGRDPSATTAAMRATNPAVIPRNHRVEEALAAAEEHDDLTALHRLLEVVTTPFDDHADKPQYLEPPANDRGYKTFCGT